jgi:dipeptidyl aminopeptidase/acylaminoacyl peptidase
MKRIALGAALAAALVFAEASPCAAQPSMHDVLRATYAVHDLSHVSLSSSGDAVVWEDDSHPGVDPSRSPARSFVYLQRAGQSSAVRIAVSDKADATEPSWSPNGSAIAFFSQGKKGPTALMLANAQGAGLRRIASLAGVVQGLKWSPDGRFISVLSIPNPHRKAGALAAGARDVGVIGSVVDEQRVGIVNVTNGSIRYLTPANMYVYEYGWSPDAKHIAFTYAYGNGDNNWWIARLASIDVPSGQVHELYKPAYQINDPVWSPDGTRVAFIQGIMSDFGSTGGDVYTVDVASGRARNITPGTRVSAASLRWADPDHLYMVAHAQGSLHLYRLNARNGAISQLTRGAETIRSWDVTQRGARVAFVRTSFDAAPEVYSGGLDAPRQISHVNAHAQRLWGKAVSLQWKSDGYNVQGWLVYPLAYNPHKNYPMVTIVHGGPSAEVVPSFGSRFVAALSSQGYFVFQPNPRGSFGQGEAFTRANVKDFGYGDWRDDLRGVDAAIASAPIDPQRLGLFGWSYGGYMAMWAETQTTRFKSIVAGAGVVNWQSYYGQNKIDEWMIPFFGTSVYQDPQVYAKSSPITFITHSKTPVLILQGERDEEVPAPQAFEFWHAMKVLNVPSQLVVYADEGHAPSKLTDQVDILNRMLNWFGRYL